MVSPLTSRTTVFSGEMVSLRRERMLAVSRRTNWTTPRHHLQTRHKGSSLNVTLDRVIEPDRERFRLSQ